MQLLEDRTVPALFAVELLSASAGVAGATGATHSGGLYLNPAYASISDAAVILDAVDGIDAVRLGLSGAITVQFGGSVVQQRYRMAPSINVGRDVPEAAAQNWSYAIGGAIAVQNERVPPPPGTVYRVVLEDLAGTANSDADYNDRYWDVRVTAVGAGMPPFGPNGPTLEIQGPDGGGLSNVKVGKWENAFDPTQGGNAPTLKQNFIDLDPDRFNIRVVDLRYATGGQLNGFGKPRFNGTYNPANDPTVLDKISVYVITSVDTGAWITLTEEALPGFLWVKSHL